MRHCIADYSDLLLKGPLFHGISRQALAELLGDTPDMQTCPKGSVLRAAGSHAASLSILLTGSALVYKGDAQGRRLLMNQLGPGSVFGVSTLFAQAAGFPTEIVAEQSCVLLRLSRTWMTDALSRSPQLTMNYVALLSDRICFLNQRIDALGVDGLPDRLLRLLRSYAAERGDGHTFMLPVSLAQLAEMLGAGRASLYRALDALTLDGRVERDGRRVTLRFPNSTIEKEDPTQ